MGMDFIRKVQSGSRYSILKLALKQHRKGTSMQRILKTPRTQEEWVALNRQLLKAHITLAGMTFEDLRLALARIGFVNSEVNIRTRVNRGRYSAVFLLQCLRAMGVDQLILPIAREDEGDARYGASDR
jgi:hypothetical protein